MTLRHEPTWYEEPLPIELSLEEVLADLDAGVAFPDAAPVGASS